MAESAENSIDPERGSNLSWLPPVCSLHWPERCLSTLLSSRVSKLGESQDLYQKLSLQVASNSLQAAKGETQGARTRIVARRIPTRWVGACSAKTLQETGQQGTQ
jgi:hypothetical protein